MQKRPILVTLLGLLLIVMGTIGFVYHLREFHGLSPFPTELVLISFLRLLAIVSGAFILRGANWARWLAIAWMALHVGVSYFHSWSEVVMHAVFLVIFAFVLFTKGASEYFQRQN